MLSFDKKDLQNKEIPSVVKAFLTEDMHNYIVVLDGHIVAQNLTEEYSDITIEDASTLSEEFVKYYESDSVNSLTSESIEYNKQNTNSGLFVRAKETKLI